MNSCRVWRKGSGVVFGQPALHVVDRSPKTTPDPVAYHQTKSDTYCFAGPELGRLRMLYRTHAIALV